MKRILLFGGSGGLGSKLTAELSNEYNCLSLSSKMCNVTDEEKVREVINSQDFDVIIYLSVKNIDGLIHKQSFENVNQQLNVNLVGFLNVLRYATPKLRENGFGRIIYISSVLSKNPIRGTGIYSASKAFCDNLMKTYSLENSKYGITSNSIQLGYFEGGLTDKVPENIISDVVKKIPSGRLGTNIELASIIKLVIENSYVNGTTLSITGGYENE